MRWPWHRHNKPSESDVLAELSREAHTLQRLIDDFRVRYPTIPFGEIRAEQLLALQGLQHLDRLSALWPHLAPSHRETRRYWERLLPRG